MILTLNTSPHYTRITEWLPSALASAPTPPRGSRLALALIRDQYAYDRQHDRLRTFHSVFAYLLLDLHEEKRPRRRLDSNSRIAQWLSTQLDAMTNPFQYMNLSANILLVWDCDHEHESNGDARQLYSVGVRGVHLGHDPQAVLAQLARPLPVDMLRCYADIPDIGELEDVQMSDSGSKAGEDEEAELNAVDAADEGMADADVMDGEMAKKRTLDDEVMCDCACDWECPRTPEEMQGECEMCDEVAMDVRMEVDVDEELAHALSKWWL